MKHTQTQKKQQQQKRKEEKKSRQKKMQKNDLRIKINELLHNTIQKTKVFAAKKYKFSIKQDRRYDHFHKWKQHRC